MRARRYTLAALAGLICLWAAAAAHAGDRVYWTDDADATISAAGRIYWANYNANKISFANLNGSGGGDLNTGAATVNYPTGVAIDSASGRIYWANNGAGTISFANLDGSGGGDLTITGTAVSDPAGVAIDPAA